MHQSVSSERVARIRVIDSYMMSIECGAVLRPMTLFMAEARYDFSIQYFFLKKKNDLSLQQNDILKGHSRITHILESGQSGIRVG